MGNAAGWANGQVLFGASLRAGHTDKTIAQPTQPPPAQCPPPTPPTPTHTHTHTTAAI